jgi:UDP-N-acetylglucosamine--N-acetylmuramyl-(pentapeptide) pyrophosphoryl-undecaprenol N-acetylglucosamine transferase
VAQSLKQQRANLDILWVGSLGGLEEALVKQADLKIELIAAAGLRGKNPLVALKNLGLLYRGYRQSQKIVGQFQPDALLITGGYVSAPVTLAAYRAGIPIVIYLPDIEPGLAVKFLARLATRVAVTTVETQKYFRPGLTVVTGYPIRPELRTGPPDETQKMAARQQLGLQPNLPTILVFGGSRGARSINRAVAGHIEKYLEVCQVVHISGQLDETWVRARQAELPPTLQSRYYVSAYLHQTMGAALQAADLVISRAGAAVLGEYPAIGLPAILVPLPIAGGHQRLNADYLARHGAAVTIADADLNEDLMPTALDLITNKSTLQAMSQASSRLAKLEAAERLAQTILEVGAHGRS